MQTFHIPADLTFKICRCLPGGYHDVKLDEDSHKVILYVDFGYGDSTKERIKNTKPVLSYDYTTGYTIKLPVSVPQISTQVIYIHDIIKKVFEYLCTGQETTEGPDLYISKKILNDLFLKGETIYRYWYFVYGDMYQSPNELITGYGNYKDWLDFENERENNPAIFNGWIKEFIWQLSLDKGIINNDPVNEEIYKNISESKEFCHNPWWGIRYYNIRPRPASTRWLNFKEWQDRKTGKSYIW